MFSRSVLVKATCLGLLLGVAALSWNLLSPSENAIDSLTPVENTSVSLDREEIQSGERNGFLRKPPFSLFYFQSIEEYHSGEALESWRILSELSCSDCALQVLETIRSQNLELIEAGYMDLSGECWGCVVKDSNGESLSIMLIPQRPFSPRSDTNLLAINILHYLEPQGLI